MARTESTHENPVDPYGRFFSAQEQSGESGECGMHCIRNLLETDDVDKESLNKSAKIVARITGDHLYNHQCNDAWWSSDTIIFELSKRGYESDYHYKSLSFDDPSLVGYIVQIPEKFHYIAVRRSRRANHSVEVVDSMTGIETMRMRRLALSARKDSWNVISVKTSSRN